MLTQPSKRMYLYLILITISFIAYFPSIQCDYIWDDDQLPKRAQELGSIDGLKRIWSEIGATSQYYPLTWTSYWLENLLFGKDPTIYHVTNIFLHSFVAVLIFHILGSLNISGAFLAALIFVVHPIHTESVSWIAERKNVLSTFFYLSSFLFFMKHIVQTTKSLRMKWYILSLIFYLAALLSKTISCSLPAVLILILWWKNELKWKSLKMLIPFFLLGASFAFLTIWIEKSSAGASGTDWDLSFVERCLIAGRAVLFYISKILAPVDLVFMYPRWEISASNLFLYSFPLVALGLVYFLWRMCRFWGKGPLTAYLFFLGTSFPALGFFNIYPMRYTFVANHYVYLPSVGIIALFVSSLIFFLNTLSVKKNKLLSKLCLIIPLIFFIITLKSQSQYENEEALWKETIKKNPQCWVAHNNLATILSERGELNKGLYHSRISVNLNPNFIEGLNNYSRQLTLARQYEEAKKWLGRAFEYHEKNKTQNEFSFARTNYHLAEWHRNQQNFDEAIKLYLHILKLAPDDYETLNSLGSTLISLGKYSESIEYFQRCLKSNKEKYEAYFNLGNVYRHENQYDKAIKHFRRALILEPRNPYIIYRLGDTLILNREIDEGLGLLRRFLRFHPNSPLVEAAKERIESIELKK